MAFSSIEIHNEYHRKYQRKIRAEIKQDPERYALYKEKLRLASKKYRKDNPQKAKDAVNASTRKRYHSDPEFRRASYLRSQVAQKKRYHSDSEHRARLIEKRKYSKYGLTPDDYFEMLEAQDYKCLVCGVKHKEGKTTKLHVDHCHETGKVRGLLCMHCNLAAGFAKDDPVRLRSLADYLEAS